VSAPSNVPQIQLKGQWTVRVPSVGGMPADGMRICTDVVIYPGGPWVSFTSDGREFFVSRPMILEPFKDARKSERPPADGPRRELPGLREALARERGAA
jgi:hypothetical protein